MWCHLSTLSRFPSKSCETLALITEKVGFSMCSYVLLAAFRHLVPNFFGFLKNQGDSGFLGVDGYSCHGIPTDVSTTDRVKGGLFQVLHFLGGKTKKLGKDSEILVSSFGSKCVRIATLAHLEAEAFTKCIEYRFLHHHPPLMKVLWNIFKEKKPGIQVWFRFH